MSDPLQGLKILIVDDNEVLRLGLSKLFSRAGAKCLLADDGTSGFESFKKEAPDFCIVDVMMEDMNGFELCASIRSERATTPIIMLSARREPVDRIRGLEIGADDYLAKPFDPDELLARVRTVLRRVSKSEGPSNSDWFAMAGTDVYPNRLEAVRGDKRISLTLRELRILQLLFINANRITSRNELLDFAWGIDYEPNSRALDQAMAVLRKKIEENPAKPQLIQTVRGGGYVFKT
ncbi:MAG: response regulator transcription factor [Pseudomonadota bacterium]